MTRYATFHDLAGACVFITGGGSGIGAALTDGFMEQGAKVAFVQRSDASGFVGEMEDKHGNSPLFIKCDISNVSDLQQAILHAEATHGATGVLVNNAADDTRHRLKDYAVPDWDRNLNVNLRPHFFAAQAVAQGMKANGGGAIVNFSSIAYLMGNAGYPAYAASKAAIVGLTRALARELGGDNIRVNALLPGWVMTERQLDRWATPEDLAAHLEKQCLKEHLVPRDVVDAALFLASKASRMMTGQGVVVDGGVAVTG